MSVQLFLITRVEKKPVKIYTPSPEPEADSLTPPHSPFVYSPSDSKEKPFHFNDEDEHKEGSENDSCDHSSEASEEEPILEWDLHAFSNICNANEQFKVPAVFPDSFPIINKKRGAGFVKDGFLFTCNNQKKNMMHHHYHCNSLGCPTKSSTIGFTQVKELTIEHDCKGSNGILYYLMHWYLCQAILLKRGMNSSELVTHTLLHLNANKREKFGENTKIQRYVTNQRSIEANIDVSARNIDKY
ncbi:hypothetical protein DSO57_1020378 [Entomophthora muscae]|uniref:Uncharacterized protein n=1 Tax=Entomophthora muscae TaxID=34485 RepID=A0ACC2UD35_9FUNG|nr:hypothetical protein DSO57_1020378 [Entomophthora muscae]